MRWRLLTVLCCCSLTWWKGLRVLAIYAMCSLWRFLHAYVLGSHFGKSADLLSFGHKAFSKKNSHCEVGGFRRDQWWSLCIGNAAVGQKCFLRWIETSTLELHVLFAAIGESHLRFLRNPGPRSVAWRVCASYQWGERCSQLMLPHFYSNNRCLSVVQHVTKLRVILSCVALVYRSVFNSCGAWLESFLPPNKIPGDCPVLLRDRLSGDSWFPSHSIFIFYESWWTICDQSLRWALFRAISRYVGHPTKWMTHTVWKAFELPIEDTYMNPQQRIQGKCVLFFDQIKALIIALLILMCSAIPRLKHLAQR